LKAVRSFFKRHGYPAGTDIDEINGAMNEEFCKIARNWKGGRGHDSDQFERYAMERLKWRIVDWLRVNGPRARGRTEDGIKVDGKHRPIMVPWMIDSRGDGDEIEADVLMRPEDHDPGFEGDAVGWDFVQHVFTKCTERERTVLWMRYVEGHTLWDIGVKMGVTESRVSQIESKALRKLRKDPDVVTTAAGLLR
jgi:RNA polymerase sigma factor (sigma-70 family)